MNKPAIVPLSPKLSDMCLKRYFESFLDRERYSYKTHQMLEALRKRKGYGSSGHNLWDYLNDHPRKRAYVISDSTLRSYTHKLREVLIYWDTCYMEPDSPFPAAGIVSVADFRELTAHFQLCPANLYVFDRDMRWTLIRTDAPHNELEWSCFQIGEIGAR